MVHLFSRVLDPRNFYWTVLHATCADPALRNAVVHRLGWLNVLDVARPEIDRLDLDLKFADHRKLAHVFTQSPGEKKTPAFPHHFGIFFKTYPRDVNSWSGRASRRNPGVSLSP